MNHTELRAIRKRIAPMMSQRRFARALGYDNADLYRRYENGTRPVPASLAVSMRLLDERGSMPDWMLLEDVE